MRQLLQCTTKVKRVRYTEVVVSPRTRDIQELARECGFELAGAAAAGSAPDIERYREWVASGMAGEMRYLTDHRAAVREDVRRLLPSARTVICVGKLYNTPYPAVYDDPGRGWISRYAWGDDYHDVLRRGLEQLDARLRERVGAFESRICVDTAPLLERSFARLAGLGWIGKNTCLIHEGMGSWFFLGELLVSFTVEPDAPPPDRCGTCTRCIDACPTDALTPYSLDARRCISYLTIELRGPTPEDLRPDIPPHIFGCDICQDVCPWNRRAPCTGDPAFAPRAGLVAPPLAALAGLSEEEFRERFRGSAVKRTKFAGFRRNVASACERIP